MSEELTPEAWSEHYQRQDIPWDLGGVTPALVAWAKKTDLKGKRVLAPGCGRGHDAHFLAKQGARVVGLDYSNDALEAAKEAYPNSSVKWVCGDATSYCADNAFDYIWEYTCFCALDPSLRPAYFANLAANMHGESQYLGMVFVKVPDPEGGPPFEVDTESFKALLEAHFKIKVMEVGTDRSVKDRFPNEIWFQVQKK